MPELMQICNKSGAAAYFTQDGWLQSFCCDTQIWELTTPQPAWSISLCCDEKKIDVTTALPSANILQKDESRFTANFKSVCLPDGRDLAVDVSVEWYLKDDLLCAKIKVGRLPFGYILDEVVIPDVSFSYSGHTRLIIAKDSGFLLDDAASVLFNDGESFFTDSHMQMLGWQDDEKGLYLESRDIDGWMKYWEIKSESEMTIRFRQHHIAPRGIDDCFELGYQVGIGTFSNDWYGCAQKYRKWALDAPWSQRGREEREDSYISKLACWLWNRGRADEVCPPALELSRRLGLPVALDWYWWHDKAYDTGYPEYFPPRDGEENFKSAVKELQSAGNFVQVYTNGMSWDMELPSWQIDGKDCAVEYANGEFQNVIYNTWTKHRLAHTCGASTKWHDTVIGIANEVSRLGLDGLYLDQIAFGGGQCPCYSSKHGHMPGGGYYGVAGYRQLLQKIRKQFPNLVLSSEGTLEFFNDILDANITLSPSFERCRFYSGELKHHMTPIPLFNAIYHGLAVCFGNYAIIDAIPPYDEYWPKEGRTPHEQEKNWHALCPDQFAMEIARTVSFGIQPMAANLTMEHLVNPDFAADIDFLIDLCKFYHANNDWLLWGEMLPPGVVKCPDVQILCVERGVFTKPQDAPVEPWILSPVFCSEWKNNKGDSAAFMINYLRHAIEFDYLPPAGYKSCGLLETAVAVPGNMLRITMPARSMLKVQLEEQF